MGERIRHQLRLKIKIRVRVQIRMTGIQQPKDQSRRSGGAAHGRTHPAPAALQVHHSRLLMSTWLQRVISNPLPLDRHCSKIGGSFSSASLGSMSSIVLSSYSREWPETFVREHDLLVRAFDPVAVTVEHIGSTAVPGLTAKPVIDILLGASSLAAIESRIGQLGTIGYEYITKYERDLPLRRYFVKSATLSCRVHLHAVEQDSRFWRDHLAFRDMLRSDSHLRAKYEALKISLAADLAQDKAAYTAAKGPFIQAALAGCSGSGDAA